MTHRTQNTRMNQVYHCIKASGYIDFKSGLVTRRTPLKLNTPAQSQSDWWRNYHQLYS